MNEQEYIEQIEKAFLEKRWDDVILHENNLLFLAYKDLAKLEGVAEDRVESLPKEKILAYFQNHNYAPLFTKKGIASMNVADFNLARVSFETAVDSLGSLASDTDAYLYLALLQAMEGLNDVAKKTLSEGFKKNSKMLVNFDEKYNLYIEPFCNPEFKEQFLGLCKLAEEFSKK